MTAPTPRGRRSLPAKLLTSLVVMPAAIALLGLSGCTPPSLSVRVVARNLTIPWDLTFAPNGTMLFTERGGVINVRHPDGVVAPVTANLSDLFVSGETGLMAIAFDPAFESNRRVYTCQGWTNGSSRDVRVVPWTLRTGARVLDRLPAIVTGMPITSGRHGGCRLRFDSQSRLWIGTGDAAVGTNPQDLTSLGGKILRVDRITGQGVSGNPFISSTNANTRRLISWGHRNVQGVAFRPQDGSMWTVEHGPDRDDEVNEGIVGNFGWDPVPGYSESVPMTDFNKFPTAKGARWSSGVPTVATSGATWLTGSQWEGWDGTLAVAALKDSSLRIMRLDGNRNLSVIATVFKDTYGRLRTAQLGPGGKLYLTTSNGGGTDVILEVTPS